MQLLSKYKDSAKILAGGTDLLVRMKHGTVRLDHLINIQGVPELRGIQEIEDSIIIGSATNLRNIERSKIVSIRFPLLLEAIRSMASVQIRNMATLGGNICNASPAADTVVALIALGAEVIIKGASRERTVLLEEFCIGPGETVLKSDEILKGVKISGSMDGNGSVFLKLSRTHFDVATANIAVVFKQDGEFITEIRLVLGAVAPIPLRIKEVEEGLKGAKLTNELLHEIAEVCCKYIVPIDDVRASANYRIAVTKALVYDALKKACTIEGVG
jgi:carbon-monoxide dehydrogenase medium subunit